MIARILATAFLLNVCVVAAYPRVAGSSANCSVYNATTSTCLQCYQGFGIKSGACTQCTGATYSTGSTTCLNCSSLVSHCAACNSSSGVCTSCEAGLNLTNGFCVSSSPSSSTSAAGSSSSFTQPPQLPVPSVVKLVLSITASGFTTSVTDTMQTSKLAARWDYVFPGAQLVGLPQQNKTTMGNTSSGEAYFYNNTNGVSKCTHTSSASAAAQYYGTLRDHIGIITISSCTWNVSSNSSTYSSQRADMYCASGCELQSGYSFTLKLYYALGSSKLLGGAGSGIVSTSYGKLPATVSLTVSKWSETEPEVSAWNPPSACVATAASSDLAPHNAATSFSASTASSLLLLLLLLL